MAEIYFDPIKEMDEIINQLSVSKRIGFFFGAGTSMALGMPGIEGLTREVINNMDDKKKYLDILINEINDEKAKDIATVEDILNKIRLIRELTKDKHDRFYGEISGELAKELDLNICSNIYKILSHQENEITCSKKEKFQIPQKLFAWLNMLNGENIKEIFTANYDLIFEKSMEKQGIPYFDGFIGAHEPFFYPESVENIEIKYSVPFSWIRLWKIHGSLGWFWKKENDSYRVVRLRVSERCDNSNELVIYPSKEKYESSRKQPFITYLDRMKKHLIAGEGIFIINGYSFADDHINELIYDALRRNSKIHVICYLFKDEELNRIQEKAVNYLNMSIYSPKKAIISGKIGEWKDSKTDENYKDLIYWDFDNETLTLGDFGKLVDFLVENSGYQSKIVKKIGEKDEN